MTDIGKAGRRAVLGVVAATAVVSVAACQTYGQSSSGSGSNPDTGPTTLAATDVPVGGGKILQSEQIVVTQPVSGTFKAFSAVCTHRGCVVANVSGGTINCTCHGSQFAIADGAVVTAAAGFTKDTQKPLPAKTVTANGDQLTVS